MRTAELIANKTRAELGIGATRWGLTPSAPGVVAVRLLEPKTAVRVCRRGADAGALQLVRLMVEHGGATVPRLEALEPEAARLDTWFPFVATDAGWAMPADLCAAAIGFARTERFFAASLVARLDDADVRTLAAELGVSAVLPLNQQRRGVAEAVRGAATDGLEEVAAATAALGSVPTDRIDAVVPLPGHGGRVFEVTTDDGVHRVCPRELAEHAGARFEGVTVERASRVATPKRDLPSVRVPAHQAVGCLITFTTPRAAEEASRFAEFRAVIARRLDDRVVATRPSVGPEETYRLLTELGFHIDSGEVSR